MILKKFVFIILFINVVFLNTAIAQKDIAVDNIIKKYPKSFNTTEKLAERIQKDFSSEYDKARAIFTWLALNMSYDTKTFLNPPNPKVFTFKNNSERDKKIQDYEQEMIKKAFRTQRGVCEDFSRLYAHIGTLVGLKVQIIQGDAKTLLNDIGRKRLYSNHAWNIVEIDGKWCLVDVTWGEGYFDYSRKVAIKHFKPIYFDMDPKYFFAKHFPDSGNYLNFKLSKETYLNGPLIYDKMMEGDYAILSPESGVIVAKEGEKLFFKIKNLSEFNNISCTNENGERFEILNLKEENNILEFEVLYKKNKGGFITFYRFENALASFKIIAK